MSEEIDFLTEDPEISSQKVVLLSFLSPEKILESKDIFFFTQFVKDYDLQWKTSKLEKWMADQLLGINDRLEKLAGSLDRKDLSGAAQEVRNQQLRVDRFVEDFQDYKRSVQKELKTSTINEDYVDFMFRNGEKLEEEFHAKNNFQTTIRGIKVRGVYPTEAEATARAKRLQKADPNFNIFLGSVGKWMAWDPEPSRVPNQEYANEQLNTLMKKYRENEESRDQYYTEQKNRQLETKKTSKVIENVTEEGENSSSASAATGSPFSTGGGTSYEGLFSGPADLAIARKAAKKEETKEEKKEE